MSSPEKHYCFIRSLHIALPLLCAINASIVLFVIPHLNTLYPSLYNFEHFPDGYDQIASNIIEGAGYRFYPETAETLMRSPGYTLLLAAIFLLFGKSLLAAKIANVILTILTAYLIASISRKYVNNNTSVLFVPAFFLLHPATIVAEARGGLEIFFAFALVLFVYCIYKAIESHKALDHLLAGSILGLALLIKSTALFFPIFLLPCLLFSRASDKRSGIVLRNFAFMIIAAFLILTPWIVRNYMLSTKFIPMTTLRGLTMYQGLYVNKNLFSKKEHWELLAEAAKNQDSFAIEAGLPFKRGFYQYFYHTNDEVAFDNILVDKVKEEYTIAPSLFVRNCILNGIRFWVQGKTRNATILNIILTVPFLCLVILGVYFGLSKNLNIMPITLLIAAYILPHLVTIAVARYYMPLIPLLSILASISLLHIGSLIEVRFPIRLTGSRK